MKYFRHVEEIEWAIEVALEFEKPVASTVCISPSADAAGVPPGECAVRMTRAGADIVHSEHVRTAEDRRVFRSDRVAEKIRELIADGTLPLLERLAARYVQWRQQR